MHILFLALTIYLLGTAVVLYLRPRLMFHAGGAWKEFSLNQGPNHTYMPFWLFTILWSLVSYLVASVIQRSMALSESSVDNDMDIINDTLLNDNNNGEILLGNAEDFSPIKEIAEPVSKTINGLNNNTKNGYYVLDTNKYSKTQVPMYVYYGDSPPSTAVKAK